MISRTRQTRNALHSVLMFSGSALLCLATARCSPGSEVEYFEKQIRPLFVANCYKCHNEKKQEGGLRLDSRLGWQKGGYRGPALVPGKPETSLLISAVAYTDKDLQMPPGKSLPAAEVELLKEWVKRGAIDPRTEEVPASTSDQADWEATFQSRLDWWSLKPIGDPAVPRVENAAWAGEPIDCFILSGMAAANISPAGPAERDVLLRRLTFVLTGLPPSPQQRERFLANWSRDPALAKETLVDEMLASPHFGERFARHWMDVVRYSDTYGYESDNRANGSWEYRDYLVRAFNGDVGFQQLVKEHIAGDLLPAPRMNPELGLNESVIGPMFYHLGEHREGGSIRFNGVHQQMVDNKIDAFSKSFLALTVACARCHDHKLEAISQRDYYALAATFMRPRWTARIIDAPGRHDAALMRLKELRSEIRQELAKLWLAVATKEDAWTWEILHKAAAPPENSPLKSEELAYPLAQFGEAKNEAVPLWNKLASDWQVARAQRQAANQNFQILADFQSPQLPEGWVMEGVGIEQGHVTEGTPLIALEGETVVARLLPRGYHTHALSSKLPGALRMPPDHLVPGRMVSLQLAGGDYAGYLVIQENGFKSEEIGFFKSPEPGWKSFSDTGHKHGVQKVTVEFATTALNPNFPPRPGLADGLPANDAGYDKRSWFSITQIVTHDQGGTPQDTLDHFAGLYSGEVPSSSEEVSRRVREWLTLAVRRWCEEAMEPGDTRIVNWLLAKNLLPNRAEPGTKLTELIAEYRRLEGELPFPRSVTGMDERETPRAGYPLNIRGNPDVTGEIVQQDFLQMFAGRTGVAKSSGSGRLELAEFLVGPENPLTARVYANRVWQWVFGAGLVATPNDFGHLGARPANPALLDYLARELMRQNWSTKQLVRRLVLSQSFLQAGTASPVAVRKDPENRLLHHFATRRLEAEAIRDSLLAVSGRLDPALAGRPIDPPRVLVDTLNKRLATGPLDGHGRRSIYLALSIMDPPKFLLGFNLPDLKLSSGQRDVTNVPAQSLILMNDPFVNAMARHWAAQVMLQPHSSPEERIDVMFVQALGREPDAGERARWRTALRDFATADQADIMHDEAAWQRLAHALFNTAEFIYFR